MYTNVWDKILNKGNIDMIDTHFASNYVNITVTSTVNGPSEAKDMASFDKFWDEYVSRVRSRHPNAFGSITKYFNAHKDNIYTIRNQYPEPPKR